MKPYVPEFHDNLTGKSTNSVKKKFAAIVCIIASVIFFAWLSFGS